MDCLRRVTRSKRERKIYHCSHAERAVDAQDHLGSFAILRGHHHVQWAHSIMKTYKPPQGPPGNDPPKSKTPFELSVLLIESVWKLFESLWEKRNDILHRDDGVAARAEESQLTTQLLQFRRRRHTLLRATDRHHIEHSITDIIRWPRKKKRKHLQLLQKLHSIYINEIREEQQGQRTLLSYGFLLPTDAPDLSEREPD